MERQKVEGREVKGPARKAKTAASWVDMGPGCCGGLRKSMLCMAMMSGPISCSSTSSTRGCSR